MIIHKVNNPFQCRVGQFTPDKRDLCVGLDLNTVNSTDVLRVYIGKNRTVYYEIDKTKALEIGQEWKNPKGKTVLIVPVAEFNKVDEKEEKLKRIEELKNSFK